MPPGTKLSEPISVTFSATADGDNTLVAAVADHIIAVVGIVVTATAGANTPTITNGAAGTVLARFPCASSSIHVLPQNEDPWFETRPGTALIINNPASFDSGGLILYHLIPSEDVA